MALPLDVVNSPRAACSLLTPALTWGRSLIDVTQISYSCRLSFPSSAWAQRGCKQTEWATQLRRNLLWSLSPQPRVVRCQYSFILFGTGGCGFYIAASGSVRAGRGPHEQVRGTLGSPKALLSLGWDVNITSPSNTPHTPFAQLRDIPQTQVQHPPLPRSEVLSPSMPAGAYPLEKESQPL